jgi:hypothetical protein
MRLVLAAILTALPLAAQQCDRTCLRDMLDQYLNAMVKHNPDLLPLSSMVRITEDGVEIAAGEGLWKTATGLTSDRIDVLDVPKSTAGTHTVVLENGRPVQLVLRLKIFGLRIHEVETMVGRDFPGLLVIPFSARPLSRDDGMQAAQLYATGRNLRIAAIDEQQGIVWTRIDYGQRVAWEMLTIRNSRAQPIHTVSKPAPSPSGWN